MVKVFSSETQKTGEVGESIACRYLESKGFRVVERNHTRKWGEIDIVAEKKDIIHFVEVKSVKRNDVESVSVEREAIRPEENMTEDKIVKLRRVITTYLAENKAENRVWRCDLVCVYMDVSNKKARVKMLDNIIL